MFMALQGDGVLDVVFFDIQPLVTSYRKGQNARLLIDSIGYYGFEGPDGVVVSKGAIFHWNAPEFIQYPGFEICYSFLSSGGGLYIENGFVLLWETKISYNEATQYGAGIYSSGSVYVENSEISSNFAWDGGAVYMPSGETYAVNLKLENNSVADATLGTTFNDFGGNGVSAVICESPCLAGEYGICSNLDFVNCPHNCRCKKCPLGKASKTTGATSITTCIPCTAGRIAPIEGSSSCENCPIGKFATNLSNYNQSIENEIFDVILKAASWCGDCIAGTFSQIEASMICQSCGGDFYSSEGASECKTCKKNYYYDNSECIKCMDGVNCNINGLATLKTLNLEQGYWRSNFNSSQILSCSLKKACKGGIGNELEHYKRNYRQYCFNGYKGPLCQICDEQFYRWSNECLECSNSFKQPFIAIFLLLFVITLIIITYRSINSKDLETRIFVKTTAKIFFITFQILVSIPDVFEFSFPRPYDVILNFASMFSFQFGDIIAFSCYTQTNFYDFLLFTCLVPILLCFLLFLFQLTYVQYHSICFSIGLLLLYLNCPIASVTIFKTYSCKYFDDHTYWLRADYSLNCDANIHEKYEIFAFFMILIWPIGIPCLFITLFYHYRKLLFKYFHQHSFSKQNSNLTYQELNSFRFLFEGFKTKLFFWEFVILLRRIFLIGVLVVLSQHPVWQHLSAIFLCIGSMVLTAHYWPYESLKINVFALACEMMITFTIIVGTVGLLSPNWFESSYAGIILAVGAGLIVMSSILLINYEVIQSNYQHHQHQHYIKIEYAVEFTNNKFITTLSSVHHNHISRGNILVYYYCHLELAELIIEIGQFPVLMPQGVYFSLTGPHNLQSENEIDGKKILKRMVAEEEDISSTGMVKFKDVFKSCEVVLVCSVPRFLIETCSDSLVLIPASLIQRLGGGRMQTAQDQNDLTSLERRMSPSSSLLLPSSCIERAYRLSLLTEPYPMNETPLSARRSSINSADTVNISSSSSSSSFSSSSNDTTNLFDNKQPTIQLITSCVEYFSRLVLIRKYCSEQSLTLLYHYTQPLLGPSILENGFRMSTQGQGDGGVYFSTLGPASYGMGTDQYEENIIKDCFGKERLEEYRGKDKLDLVFLCGIEAGLLEQAPGGRDNAKMISKTSFRTLGSAHKDRCYYCPPNCIIAAFLIPAGDSNKMQLQQCPQIEKEMQEDQNVKTYLISLKEVKKAQINALIVIASSRFEEQDYDENDEAEEEGGDSILSMRRISSLLISSPTNHRHQTDQNGRLRQSVEFVSRRLAQPSRKMQEGGIETPEAVISRRSFENANPMI